MLHDDKKKDEELFDFDSSSKEPIDSGSDPKGSSSSSSRDMNKKTYALPGTGRGPIVVLFGPPAVGKTVTLIRLLTYLKQRLGFEYHLSDNMPDKDGFDDVKNRFKEIMRNASGVSKAPPGTSGLDFLLVDVYDRNENLQYHLLEAPGEDFFNPRVVDPHNREYPLYLEQIFSSSQKKLYLFFFEPNMFDDQTLRHQYGSRLNYFINNVEYVRPNDKVVVVYNKINSIKGESSNRKALRKRLKDEVFSNQRDYSEFGAIVTKKSSTLKNVPLVDFTSGSFNSSAIWRLSDDKYPKSLQDSIDNQLNGSWFKNIF